MNSWTIQQARDIYNITHWSQGYFDINEAGNLVAYPKGHHEGSGIELIKIIDAIHQWKLTLPILLRFTDILTHRLHCLQQAFATAIENQNYENQYTPVYPIKVNQQHHVVNALLKSSENIGLEAGSKPELMAVMALAKANSIIICNGYKDREYIRLALVGRQLGHDIYIIIEKLSELKLILEESKKLNVTPLLGIRARLSSIAKGNWQNTGGEKSKFGLSAAQILQCINSLKQQNALSQLKLLHFHMGSQVSNIRDIQTSMSECARIFAELTGLGAKLDCIDVGGGLGVDYEGTRSRSLCSINYSLAEYAHNVVSAITEVCQQNQLPHPRIITEAGRAMVAHHAVLITNIVEVEQIKVSAKIPLASTSEPKIIQDLWQCFENIKTRPLIETYHDTCHYLQEAQTMFIHGIVNLTERARAEEIYTAICLDLKKLLQTNNRAHREIIDELNERLADKLFCNFSLFQSLPDVWAIKQIFPIMPLTGLQQKPSQRGIIKDITCDSDGRIDYYVDGAGLEKTLPLPPFNDHHNYLGFFLVGAYQEILGDMHNLFGDTNSVNIEVDNQGQFQLKEPEQGDTVDELLRYVHFAPEELLKNYQEKLQNTQLNAQQKQAYLKILEEGMSGYTYLED